MIKYNAMMEAGELEDIRREENQEHCGICPEREHCDGLPCLCHGGACQLRCSHDPASIEF